jgi:GrpB-like predicted nucleotidyltransferase (UPF0157 family)
MPEDAPIRIVPYDPAWPTRFDEERAALTAAIGDWVVGGVHHVGSTSVPGLEAKPIIDILVGVRDLEVSRSCFDQLAAIGYLYAPYLETEMHWFCKPDPSRRTHHLHLVPTDSSTFRDELAFRDYLRSHRDVAQEYGALKRDLAKEFEHDREAFTAAKADFIRSVLDRALH